MDCADIIIRHPILFMPYGVRHSVIQEGEIGGRILDMFDTFRRGRCGGRFIGSAARIKMHIHSARNGRNVLNFLPIVEHCASFPCVRKRFRNPVAQIRIRRVRVVYNAVHVRFYAVEHTHMRGQGYGRINGLRLQGIA